MTSPVGGYSCFVYATTTGKIVNELPMASVPQWASQINGAGTWQAAAVLGGPGVPSVATLRKILASGRYSGAICWGTAILQAGPLFTRKVTDTSGVITVAGGGMWNLLNRRLLVGKDWNPVTTKITDTTADSTYTGFLHDIAADMVSDNINQTHRPGSSLPIDIPDSADDGSGSDSTRFYPGYDHVSVGQRLQELTQVDGGPDVLFAPYFSDSSTIRHQMMIGTPDLQQPGNAVYFDYQSSLESLDTDDDGSNLGTGALVIGSGNERTLLSSYATDTTLTDHGYPLMDYVDTTHTSAQEQATLDGWAAADIALYGRAVETLTAVVRANTEPKLGTYWPGTYAVYNVQGHRWLADGSYKIRILGMSNGSKAGEVKHSLAAQGVL